MIALWLGGWLAASGAGLLAGGAWRALSGRMESVARASHELRGPLTAARLGLQLGASAGELSPARPRRPAGRLGRSDPLPVVAEPHREQPRILGRAGAPVTARASICDKRPQGLVTLAHARMAPRGPSYSGAGVTKGV
jgi:signal transduction histidine kinase